MTQKDLIQALEALVDKSSLSDVLMALELVTYEKAEHIRCNWQDHTTAKVWERAGKHISKAATIIHV